MANNNAKKTVQWADLVVVNPVQIQVGQGETASRDSSERLNLPYHSNPNKLDRNKNNTKSTVDTKGKKNRKGAAGESNVDIKEGKEAIKKKGRADPVAVEMSSMNGPKAKGTLFLVGENSNKKKSNVGKKFVEKDHGDNYAEKNEQKEQAEQDDEDGDDDVPYYIQCFMQFIYWIGLSAFDPGRDPDKPYGWGKFIADIVLKVIFWIGTIAAILDSMKNTKLEWLYFAVKPGITNFVDFGFQIVAMLALLFIAHLLGLIHKRFRRMFCYLVGLNEFGKNENSRGNDAENQTKNGTKKMEWGKHKVVYALVVTVCVSSILVCCLKTGSSGRLDDWSTNNLLLYHSKMNSYGVFLWKQGDLTDSTISGFLEREYGTNLTMKNKLIGALGIAMDFSSNLRLELAVDIIMMAGWCLKKYIEKHAKKVRKIDFTIYTNGNDCAELDSPTGDWARYKNLREANNAMNTVYDGLLMVMHAYNTMLSAYFLMHILDNEVTSMDFLLLLYNIIKMAIAYLIAKQSNGYNPDFQQWICDWAMHSKDPLFVQKAIIILEQMKSNPLGLGTGGFIIGETFLLKFVGMVSSLFVLQVDK